MELSISYNLRCSQQCVTTIHALYLYFIFLQTPVFILKLWECLWEYTSHVHINYHIFSSSLFNSEYHFLVLSQDTHSITALPSQMDPSHRYWNMINNIIIININKIISLLKEENSPSNSNKRILPWIRIFSLLLFIQIHFWKTLIYTALVISSPPTVYCWNHSSLASIVFFFWSIFPTKDLQTIKQNEHCSGHI